MSLGEGGYAVVRVKGVCSSEGEGVCTCVGEGGMHLCG